MKKALPALALGLTIAITLTGCNLGAAGIGSDGSVKLGDQQDAAAVTVEDGLTPAADAAQDASQVAGPPAEEAETGTEEAAPDLSGLQEYEAPAEQETDALLPQTDADPILTPAGEFYDETSPTKESLSDALAALDPDVAAELESYYAQKQADADAQGLTMTLRVSYNTPPVLSIVRSITGADSASLRAETYQTTSGARYLASDFFPGLSDSDLRDLLAARVVALLEASDKNLLEGWRDTVKTAFEPDKFYLTDEGYCVFYGPGVLSVSGQELVIPYADLEGSFVWPS